MRCIEINIFLEYKNKWYSININMRCIEIQTNYWKY